MYEKTEVSNNKNNMNILWSCINDNINMKQNNKHIITTLVLTK